MTTYEEYLKVFCETLEIKKEDALKATPKTIDNWDSIKQMALVVTLEDTFDIELEPNDIIKLNSFEAGLALLKEYEVISVS
jgi:acyl carrier protein